MSTAIVADLREVILHRFRTAPLRELLELTPNISEAVAPPIRQAYEIIDDDLVIDHSTGLTWLRDFVPGGARDWSASLEAASAFKLRGFKFRAPTIVERLSINDYERHNPALHTNFFKGEPGWEWTSTVDIESPRDYAWFVFSASGSSNRNHQNGRGFVRAVRVGQS